MTGTSKQGALPRRCFTRVLGAGPLVAAFAPLTSLGAAAVRAASDQNSEAGHEEPTMTTTQDSGLAEVLEQVRHALAAMASGDPEPYSALWPDRPDVTLFGAWGPIEQGYQNLTDTFRWVGGRFTGGALVPEDTVIYQSGDLAYTVGFERGDVSVDGGPLRPMTLRVTHVYRRIDGEWRLVHRHADFPPADQRLGAR
jgi:ketosteroid isomerase-like protein